MDLAGRDLRALFSTNDPRLEAGEAFTNRQLQWELVAAALTGHLQRTADPAFDVEDLEAPRDNVMVFHGVGGIGKTTLSCKIEAALAGAEQRPAQWGEPTWAGERIWPVRIDLSRSAGTSFEDLVLTIRARAQHARPPAARLRPGLAPSTCAAAAWPAVSARRCRSRCSWRWPTSLRPSSCPARSVR